jgi:hypothetical protein
LVDGVQRWCIHETCAGGIILQDNTVFIWLLGGVRHAAHAAPAVDEHGTNMG